MKLAKHFDFTKMQKLDPAEWNIEVGDKWANNEKQHYVSDSDNLYLSEAGLTIKATLKDGIYKSARINTKDKVYFQYGKIDIVAKVPKGKGTWPALWMMSNDRRYGRWPRSGEIDIMEHAGNELDELYLCLHTEAYNHTRNDEYFTKIKRPGISDDFQTFSLIWRENEIIYLLNDEQVAHYRKGEEGKDVSAKGWPFDHPFHLIINMAIGGSLGGEIDDTCFPQKFIVKDIKIYQ